MSTQKQDVILASDAPAPAFSFEAMQRMSVSPGQRPLAEVELRRGKTAAAYAPAREFTQLAAETGQAFYLPSRL